MAIVAFAAPILPGKRDQWDSFIAEITGSRRDEFNASRQRHGMHERNFLQETPMGDLVLVTIEGDNPMAAMGAMANGEDDFTRWFIQQVKEIHGFDLRQPPEYPPRQIIDSETSSEKQNKATFRRLMDEAMGQGNLGVIEELVSPDWVNIDPSLPEELHGHEGFRQLVTMFHSAFSNFNVTVDDMVAEGDKIAARITVSGTQTGELMGIPPTGKHVRFTGTGVFRFVDGKDAEHRMNVDFLGLLQQLGAIPTPELAAR